MSELLESGRPVITDGAMGTVLFALGLERGSVPDLLNVERPELIRQVHRSYIEAGSQIILTNSFGGSRVRLGTHGMPERAAGLNAAAAVLARAEADAAPRGVLVGGDIGPTGLLLKPYGDLTFEEATAAFEEQIRALAAGGVDAIWIETMYDLEEVRAAVEAAHRAAPELPVVATMTFDAHGRTMMGTTPEQAVEVLSGLGVAALGGNCGNGTEEILTVVEKMRAARPDVVLVAKANAGMPRLSTSDRLEYDATPETMAEYAGRVQELGATIIGACCGSTPEHIRAIAERLHA
ncbi:MAG: homocysteine S-methyltransferase family protein [Anaerolineae bacterium]|nr:homocysteine S-methyltransferase family protein [Anaerolineae bacterium]